MPWQLGSGNKTDYDIYITDSYFSPDANYQNGETTLLHLLGIDENGEECREIYNVGKDWISPDGGRTVQSTKGNKIIPRNSTYGKFLEGFLQLGPRVAQLFEGRGDANEAAVWAGAVFHMHEVEFVFGRNLDPIYKNVPEYFLGWYDKDTNIFTESEIPVDQQGPSDTPARSTATRPSTRTPSRPASTPAPVQPVAVTVAPPASTAPTGKTAPATALTPQQRAQAAIQRASKAASAPIATPEPIPTNGNGHADLFSEVQSLAESSPDFETFANTAAEIPGLTDDEELSNIVFDPTESGMFALAHAK